MFVKYIYLLVFVQFKLLKNADFLQLIMRNDAKNFYIYDLTNNNLLNEITGLKSHVNSNQCICCALNNVKSQPASLILFSHTCVKW